MAEEKEKKPRAKKQAAEKTAEVAKTEDKDLEIKSIDKGYGKSIKVKIAYWKDNAYIDIREYYLSEDDEALPTKKGVRFPVDMIDEILEGLQDAKDKVAEE